MNEYQQVCQHNYPEVPYAALKSGNGAIRIIKFRCTACGIVRVENAMSGELLDYESVPE